ncbi:MAG TPA: hypothetical protein VKV36_01390 [Acidimicrobiales bacterium]|nr:hypothetical protein [Acidimicrobiales bacterium]
MALLAAAVTLAACSSPGTVAARRSPTSTSTSMNPPAGDGTTSTLPSTLTTTTPAAAPGPSSVTWPLRTITSTGSDQDVTPVGSALYWLALPGSTPGSPSTVTPVRDDLATGQVVDGPSVPGVVGSPALTVTAGWVWVVRGVGGEALVEQLDPTTLTVHAQRTLVVNDTLGPGPRPLLTATVGGPLWVADGEDLWALDPSTGTVETELDAGDEITSLSTDPSGALLYTGGDPPSRSGMIVTEYDARTGRQLDHSDQEDAVAAGTVAATDGGVWVSYRSGMAGGAQELSSADLATIAPPPGSGNSFGTFAQIMGVWSSVSDGVLWLTSATGLTCADPATGAVRASEALAGSDGLSDPIASGGLLYAVPSSGGVVAMTPPKACFGT